MFAALPKKTGESCPAQDRGGIEWRAGHLQHLDFLLGLEEGGVVEALADDGVIQPADLHRGAVGAANGALEEVDLLAEAIVHPAEVGAEAERVIHRAGGEAEHVFQFVKQGERLEGRAVEFVEEGEDRHAAPAADLEEFAGLRLDALAGVDHHDGGVDGGEHAVRILGEILMPRGVEQVDPVPGVIELEDGRGDGDAALAFEFHPIARGRPLLAAGSDRARELEGTAVEEEFFGERGLAGVRVTDDREGPAAGDFVGGRREHGSGAGAGSYHIARPCARVDGRRTGTATSPSRRR